MGKNILEEVRAGRKIPRFGEILNLQIQEAQETLSRKI